MSSFNVDNREKRSYIVQYLTQWGYITDESYLNLSTGDYHLKGVHDFEVIIERKADDYIADLKSRKLNEQWFRMQSSWTYSIFLTVGSLMEKANKTRLPYKNVIHSIVSAMFKKTNVGANGVLNVIQAENDLVAAQYIAAIYDLINDPDVTRLLRLPKFVREHKKTNPTKAKHYTVTTIPMIEEERANKIADKFHNIRELANASIEDLIEIDGIGKGIAEKIYKHFNDGFK